MHCSVPLDRALMSIAALLFGCSAAASAQIVQRVSVSSWGAQPLVRHVYVNRPDQSISADGRWIAFCSMSAELVPGVGGHFSIFLHDRWTHETTLVSRRTDGSAISMPNLYPALTPDGRFLAFRSEDSVLHGTSNREPQIYVKDLRTGLVRLVSQTPQGAPGNRRAIGAPSISDDGRYVAFSSLASDLVSGDTNGWEDIFVHDLSTGIVSRVSLSPSGVEGNRASVQPWIAGDGSAILYFGGATNFYPNTPINTALVMWRDLRTGQTLCVNQDASGQIIGGGSSGLLQFQCGGARAG
jgi:Tol biopolymer transport system component